MTGYLAIVRESKNYNNYKLTADKVVQILSSVRNEKTKSRRRWIWELMQNAKDVPNVYGGVTIEIILRDNEFIFSHNGNPFSVENITGLIQQVSTGKPSNSTNRRITGKFGTGFISTHLLSDVVKVQGIVEQEGLHPKRFQFVLNRKADISEDLIVTIADELDKIEKIENEELFPTYQDYHFNRRENRFDTVFTYPLENSESREAAKIGVADLASTLPQTLFFVEELKKVIIKNEMINQTISYELYQNRIENEFRFPVVRETRDGQTRDLCFIHFRDEKLDLAIQVDNFENKELITNEKSPKLYRDFPLVGTEAFYFPFILNGLNFFPTDKRDGILLTDTSSDNVIINREILTHAIEKSKQFVEWIITNNCSNLSLIAQSSIPTMITEKEVVLWYKASIQSNYRSFLLNKKIVETLNGNIYLIDAIIPKINGSLNDNEIFWDIINLYYGSSAICKKGHLTLWHHNIGLQAEIDTWGEKIFYRIEDLLTEIQSKEKLENISLKDSNILPIDWLNKVYQFLIDNKLTDYFKEYKIIPTINGSFKSFNDDIYIEKATKIPDEFIAIFKGLKEDWNEILMHRGIITIDSSHATKTIKDLSDEINKILNLEEKNQYGVVQRTFIDNMEAVGILLGILRISSTNNSESFQSKLFELAASFFNYDIPPLSLNEIEDFNFNPSIRQLLKLLNTRIEQAEKLENLIVDDAENWLKTYLLLIQDSYEFKNLLEHGNIVPNRNNYFCPFKEVYGYGTEENPLDDALIKILIDLNSNEDWDKFLIHDSFRKLLLPPKKIDELSIKIQDELEKLRVDNAFSSHSNSILALIDWCSGDPIKAQKYFGSFMSQKDKIFVNISLEDKEVGGNIVKLLSNKEKLNDLVSIAESGVNLLILSEIAEIAKTIDIQEIKNLAQDLKDEKEEFEFLKKIGEAVERAFIEAFSSENLPYLITYQGFGSHDVEISNPQNNKSFFIELKSISPANFDKSLKLAVSQARKAVELLSGGNYVVSVLIRPMNWETATPLFIKENLNNQFDIGTILTNTIEKNRIFEGLLSSDNGVDLAFNDERRKVRVSENIWRQSGHSFSILIERVKLYLG